jgi:hypothetical protein
LFSFYGFGTAPKDDTNNNNGYHFEQNASGNIIVNAYCNGNNIKGLFMLDNGTKTTEMDSAFFYKNIDTAKLKLKKPKFKMFYFRAIYEGDIMFTIGNYTFKINEIKVSNFAVKYRNSYKPMPNLNGIIGEDAFVNKITTIDFERNQIDFVDTVQIDAAYTAIPLLSKNKKNVNQKMVTVSGFPLDGSKRITLDFLLDLGSGKTGLFLKHDWYKKIANKRKVKMVYQEAGDEITDWTTDSLYLGGIFLNTVRMRAYSSYGAWDPLEALVAADGLLGIPLLERFFVIADYKNNILYLKPNNNYYQLQEN